MKSTAASNQKETYARSRDNPYFDWMRRGEAAVVNKGSISAFGLRAKLARHNIYRSSSDIGNRGSQNITSTVTEDIVLEPIGRSSSGRWSKTSSPLIVLQSELNVDYQDLDESPTFPSPDAEEEAKEESTTQNGFTKPEIQKSYNVNKNEKDTLNVPLPLSAALFYNGASPRIEVVESCESVHNLNMYLKARRDDVKAGVPGKFLHVVIGPRVTDVGSVAGTIMYAFYLDQYSKKKQFCTVPVINMNRADLDSHADLQWLLDSCHIDLPSLIFIDEIDLSYYDLFGSLKLVLLNCDKIPPEQEALKEAIVEVFHCTQAGTLYSWVNSIVVREDVSCCTVIAENFAKNSPEILAGQGFSRLLLAGILVDTGNLSSSQCTSKDKYIATLLINGAGRFGCNGLYQILKYKGSNSSDLKVEEILRKEYKKWTGSGKPNSSSLRLLTPNIGMSSIGMSVEQFLHHDPNSVQEIIRFQKLEKLGLLTVVSGYYDAQKTFKREVIVSAEYPELMKNLLLFLNSSEAQLPLKVLHLSGLKDGVMRGFEIDKIISRKTIERLLEEFISASNSY